MTAELHDRQPIDLSDPAAVGGNQRDVAQDHLAGMLLDAGGTLSLAGHRPLDVLARDDLAMRLRGPVIGFGDHVVQLFGQQRQLGRIVGQPSRPFDGGLDGATIQRFQARLGREPRDDAGKQRLVFRGPDEVVLEVGQNLEVLPELGITESTRPTKVVPDGKPPQLPVQ